ncbi:MAG TPA: helix-turn-helix transcriptional regulator [Bacillota bacterium]|nr:helix-turn-helix transcriptional regulator [Bacillota bacterium]
MKPEIKPHEKVRAAMVLKGYTQEQLCRVTGLSYSAFSLKINGHRDFTLSECARIAKALDTTLDALFFDVDVPKRGQSNAI